MAKSDQLDLLIEEWKRHTVTKLLLKEFKKEFNNILLNELVPKKGDTTDFSYAVGHKDGCISTFFRVLQPELWLTDEMEIPYGEDD